MDIRRKNLQTLVKEFKTIAALAEISGTSEKYLSQILNCTKLPSGATRNVGNALARKLETGALRPPGWMDHDHEGEAPAPRLSPPEEELLRCFRTGSKAKRTALLAVARL
jgi:hypothetical protein